jgi:hypothetical protein
VGEPRGDEVLDLAGLMEVEFILERAALADQSAELAKRKRILAAGEAARVRGVAYGPGSPLGLSLAVHAAMAHAAGRSEKEWGTEEMIRCALDQEAGGTVSSRLGEFARTLGRLNAAGLLPWQTDGGASG